MSWSDLGRALMQIVGLGGGGRVNHKNKASLEINNGTGVGATFGFDPNSQSLTGTVLIGRFNGRAAGVAEIENIAEVAPPQISAPVQQIGAVAPINMIGPPSGGDESS